MSTENREFAALFASSGWNQREVAEKLYTTTATVSRYLSNLIAVPRSSVELFKLVLATERPEALEAGAHAPELRAVQTQVREIHARDAGAFRTVRAMVDGVHRALPPVRAEAPGKTKLDPIKQAEIGGVAHLGLAAAMKSLGLKPRAASTSGKNAAPKAPAPQRKDARPAPPVPVPTSHES